MLYIGQAITWGLKTYTEAGVLADLGGGNPTATVTRPDGTTGSATVTKTATGTYSATIEATMAGRWSVEWAGSGANSAGLPFPDVADVVDQARLIIPLGEARLASNIPATVVADDDELAGHILSAADLVERELGPVLPRTVVETHVLRSAREAIGLHSAATGITGVKVDGVALADGDWLLASGSILYRGEYGTGLWLGTVEVTYTAGVSVLPASLIHAAKIIVQMSWQQEQQRQRPGLGASADVTPGVPLGFALPNSARDLLDAARGQLSSPPDPPGIA